MQAWRRGSAKHCMSRLDRFDRFKCRSQAPVHCTRSHPHRVIAADIQLRRRIERYRSRVNWSRCVFCNVLRCTSLFLQLLWWHCWHDPFMVVRQASKKQCWRMHSCKPLPHVYENCQTKLWLVVLLAYYCATYLLDVTSTFKKWAFLVETQHDATVNLVSGNAFWRASSSCGCSFWRNKFQHFVMLVVFNDEFSSNCR